MRTQTRTRQRLPLLFLGAQAVAEGWLTRGELRGPAVTRVLRGVYCPSSARVTHALRCEAAGLVLPAGAQLTGRSMAAVLGVRLLAAEDDVEVVVPDRSTQEHIHGLAVRRAVAPLLPGTVWKTTELADPRRMAFDLGSRGPIPDAVAHLDAVARGGLLDLPTTAAWLTERHEPGVRRAREVLAMVDVRAESQPESRVRAHLALAGIHLTPQVEVRDGRGVLIARVDLGDEEHRVAVEYDGEWHSLRDQLAKDRLRIEALQAAGWTVVFVSAAMMRDPDEVVDRVRSAIVRAARR